MTITAPMKLKSVQDEHPHIYKMKPNSKEY